MMPSYHFHDEYNEYLCGHQEHQHSNDILNFIQHYFAKEGKELIFSIIETTSKSNINHIGQTYIFSPFTNARAKKILEKYEEIILSIAQQFKGSIADYEEWYRKKTFFIIHSNEVIANEILTNFDDHGSNWNNDVGLKDKTLDIKKKSSTPPDFEQFLNEYGKRLHNDLELKNYPHYCIIVKPIALRHDDEDGNYLPMGNFYLIFCTKSYHDKDFYYDLLNKLSLVWFKSKWEILVNELKKEVGESSPYKPRLTGDDLKKFQNNNGNEFGIPLNTVYNICFKERGFLENIEAKYAELAKLTFEYYNEFDFNTANLSPELKNLIKGNTSQTDIISSFQAFLLLRMFCLISWNVFQIRIDQLHCRIQSYNDLNQNKEDTSTAYGYFHSQKKLHLGSKNNLSNPSLQTELRSRVLGAISIHEKEQLRIIVQNNDPGTPKGKILIADIAKLKEQLK